jgi:hypothetical protein
MVVFFGFEERFAFLSPWNGAFSGVWRDALLTTGVGTPVEILRFALE